MSNKKEGLSTEYLRPCLLVMLALIVVHVKFRLFGLVKLVKHPLYTSLWYPLPAPYASVVQSELKILLVFRFNHDPRRLEPVVVVLEALLLRYPVKQDTELAAGMNNFQFSKALSRYELPVTPVPFHSRFGPSRPLVLSRCSKLLLQRHYASRFSGHF